MVAGVSRKYPPAPAHGGAVERHGEGKLTAPSAAAGRPGGVCDREGRVFSMGRVHQMYGRDGEVRGQRVRPKKIGPPRAILVAGGPWGGWSSELGDSASTSCYRLITD